MIVEDKLRSLLSDSHAVSEQGFSILSEISQLINNPKTVDIGREMVIRALAYKDIYPEGERELLKYLVRAVGLFPYIEGDTLSVGDAIALELHRPEKLGERVVFHSVQAKIYHELISGNNVVLSAPTSVGKTLIVDAVIASGKFRKIVIVVPTIALIDEIRRRLSKKFEGITKIITHREQSMSLELPNIYVLTQERVLQRDDLDDVDFFVIDEFYKLDAKGEINDERATQLNLAFYTLSQTDATFYLSGPSIRSIKGIDRFDCHFITSPFTTVAVDTYNFNLPTRGEERSEKLLELRETLIDPTIIYCQSPDSAGRVANLILSSPTRRLPFKPSSEVKDLAEWLTENYSSEWIVCRALLSGIAIHHGAVPRAIQQQLIKLFNEEKLDTVICTQTIIEGVNTVAKNVVIYDRRKNLSVVDHFTYTNIKGRAGRMGKYFVGKVYVLEEPPEQVEFDVEIPVEVQNESTPLGILVNIDDNDLSIRSKERIAPIVNNNYLPLETIRECKGIDPTKLIEAAKYIDQDFERLYPLLAWNSIPRREQLNAVCDIIVNFFSRNALSRYQIHEGYQLAGILISVGMAGGFPNFVREKAYESRGTISDAIEDALKLTRNVVMHRAPTDMMAIHNIQSAIMKRRGKKIIGDYRAYASRLENGFLHHTIIALDEYGLPVQVGIKLSPHLPLNDGLDAVLAALKKKKTYGQTLNQIELRLVNDVRQTI